MGRRAERLATTFEQANNDVISTIEGMSDDQWKKTCAAETWSVGVTAHHVAAGYPLIAGLVQGILIDSTTGHLASIKATIQTMWA